ncbi:hypothetical protein ACMD2_08082 [Ananas comosus]|uniref:Protein NO VEIN C-terminal domain-containing protein n=1 Tax=Ananas comosus TaxID=4615 RepID=A0A199VG40_ANACO|nr:hypothetical protein ACMD2_08082 [Ananas comosus]
MMSKSTSASAREHIERVRRDRFYIGREERNPLAEDIHQANAEDNEYPAEAEATLEFVITTEDVTATGAEATLLVFNNEKGFSPANVESICRVGKSTKKGVRHRGYIGEKGIGFKSVFLISSQPHIFSNGYQIKFSEEPSPECGVGFIVPEWVEENPSLSDIQKIYGSFKSLPTTAIILPLKAEKVGAVKQQLSALHPEILLFLSKIRRLSFREFSSDPKLASVTEISISSEENFRTRKNIDAESFTLHLSANEDGDQQCSYYMWKQKFPVKPECRVSKRAEVDEWVITLAFPLGHRLSSRTRHPGVYAFLPTEMVTGFPFIIQADFLLISSRESIVLDSPWNRGILGCVPSAFVNAFVAQLKTNEAAPAISLPFSFKFLPVRASSIPVLDSVREVIKSKVVEEHIMPCQSYSAQRMFCKPRDVSRLNPAFWNILIKAGSSGVDLQSLSSHGTYILSSHLDTADYEDTLGFLGVRNVDSEWYGKCIEGCGLVKELAEEVYLELLCFIADNWSADFARTSIWHKPLLKYVDANGGVSFWSIYRASQYSDRICTAANTSHVSWLIDWNKELAYASDRFFMPESTQKSLKAFSKQGTLMDWLKMHAKVEVVSVYNYALLVAKALKDRRIVIAFTHFVYHSAARNYIPEWYMNELCCSMPLVDNYGSVITQTARILVPAKGSKWVGLMGSNPWRGENYVELGADYLCGGNFAGNRTSENQLLGFLKKYAQAADVPYIRPPDAAFPTVASPLTKDNALLLLEWIRNLRSSGVQLPVRFLNCVKHGSWLKTSVGYKPPSESFLSNENWGSLLQIQSVLVDIPMIDQQFYGDRIGSYKEELRTIGVRFEFSEALTYIGAHLMSMAANCTLTRANVVSLLQLIRFLRQKFLPPEHLIQSIKNGRWLKTRLGYSSPAGSILFGSEWTTASYISNLPFIDIEFYGEEIINYKTELELLGVIVRFNGNYQILVDNFKPSSTLIAADAVILILMCVRHATSSGDFVKKLKELRWLKTNLGYKTPGETFLVDSEWECLVKVVDGVPLIDLGFYGDRIRSFQEELTKVGVVLNLEEAAKAIARQFKQLVSSSSLTKKNVLALLASYRHLKDRSSNLPLDLTVCMRSEKWLHTKMGFRSPVDSILFDSQWESVSPMAVLPFIDDSDSCNGLGKEICRYKSELKSLGVACEPDEGANFVVTGLNIPSNPSAITPANVISVLKCIRNWKKTHKVFPKDFAQRICKRWLKTAMGYQYPDECILFDSKSCSFIQREDGPFIDEAFYGSEISSYKNELEEIGVTVEISQGCSLIARHLKSHSSLTTISRVYSFLKEFEWTPESRSANWIWIPSGSDSGEWVSSRSCVLHDKNNLFRSQLHVLEKHYEKRLLGFFSNVLGVKSNPTVEDYCVLWSVWEMSVLDVKPADCSAFWCFIAKNWNADTEKRLLDCVAKLPVNAKNGILLSDKEDVFIPDDLLLKDLFDEASEESIFIWYPSTISRAKLNLIYSSIGVRKISEAVEYDESHSLESGNVSQVDVKNLMINKTGLMKTCLAFLADPLLDISGEERHRIVRSLLDVEVLETNEQIAASYKLKLSSGRDLTVKESQMCRWEKEDSKLIVQRIDGSLGNKARIEFATYFSDEVSRGLLFDRADQIDSLAEIIKIGSLLDFDEAAVEFLLKAKNLQLFEEDEKFLSSELPSGKV